MSDEELREWIRAQMGKGLSGPQIANLLERCTPDPSIPTAPVPSAPPTEVAAPPTEVVNANVEASARTDPARTVKRFVVSTYPTNTLQTPMSKGSAIFKSQEPSVDITPEIADSEERPPASTPSHRPRVHAPTPSRKSRRHSAKREGAPMEKNEKKMKNG